MKHIRSIYTIYTEFHFFEIESLIRYHFLTSILVQGSFFIAYTRIHLI